jgi:hypothetical protein
MVKEPDEPNMCDEIRTVVFESPDKIGKVFCVLDETQRLCLVCDGVFTRREAAEHAERVCYAKLRQEQTCKARIMRTRQL